MNTGKARAIALNCGHSYCATDAATRARLSAGSTSSNAVYDMVVKEIAARHRGGGTLVDVGCGIGQLLPRVRPLCERYVGVDILRYDDFPAAAEFVAANLDEGPIGLPDESADVVVSVETIEHLESPRAFMREIVRLAKPDGLILVTTPNQLSLLSLMTLVVKGEFNQFQEAPGLYPAHLTALLEIDLLRIAREQELVKTAIVYTNQGRMPFTPWHWPRTFRGRRFSDNLMLVGTKSRTSATEVD
ncbi:MAG TPA: methyltransferase domain-containing protein [Candidatus Binataceae bacterium]|nr:methyltransferase domain-containing protein [Candidatus Binataceae bacterium]